MKKRVIFIMMFFAMVGIAAHAKSIACKSSQLKDLLETINNVDQPDSMKYMEMVDKALTLAEEEGNEDAKLQVLYDQIAYLSFFYNKSEALDKLAQLRSDVKESGKGSNFMYDAWAQIVNDYINENQLIYAVSELQKMQDYAAQQNDYYGLGKVNVIFGTLYEHSYPAASHNLDAAIEYMKMSGEKDGLVDIYYLWAKSALANGRAQEALKHVQEMMECPGANDYKSLADNIYLNAYMLLEDKDNAQKSYEALSSVWEGHDVRNDCERDILKSMAKYLISTGKQNEGLALTKYLGSDYASDKKEIEYDYYVSKRDYLNAHQSQKDLLAIKNAQLSNLQASQVAATNAFLSKEWLVDSSQNEMSKKDRDRMHLYLIIMIVVAALLLAAICLIVKYKRNIGHLQIERDSIETARQEEVKLNRMKSTFIHNMSQELRTPLNSIIGFNEILNNPNYHLSEEKRKEMLQQIHRQSEQMIQLLDNVVLLSRIDSHDIVPNIEPLKLAEVVEEAVEPLYRKVCKGVTFNIERGIMSGIEINTDREILLTVIKAVLDNAVKFTRDGMVEFDCATDGDGHLTIVVMDTGEGISAADADIVFNRFEKLGHIEQGFGLGLSTARELLDIIGGSIVLDTSYSRGARFVVTIPNAKRL